MNTLKIVFVLLISLFQVVALKAAQETGYALKFDGVNDYVEIPSNLKDLGVRNAFTITIWIRTDAIAKRMLLEDGTQWNVGSFYLGVWPQDGEIFARLNTQTHTYANDYIPVPSFAGIWSYIAYTYDGSSMKIYLNGNLVFDSPISGDIINGNRNLRVGFPSDEAFYKGLIDELRVWNIALTHDDILSTINHQLVGNKPGLVGYWSFDEGYGNSAIDLTGKGNNAILGGGSPDSKPEWVISDAPILPFDMVLSENFEDNELDPRISINTVGTFNESPGIKNITELGSTKAFGFGRSTCGANCFMNFVTEFTISLATPTYVSSLSFKEIELYGNWGSQGRIFVDGTPLTGNDFDFGRGPNDGPPDTSRSRYYPVERKVSTIKLQVRDITNESEIFIDDLQIKGTPTFDILPPSPPKNLAIATDENQATLTWTPNTETDLLRYRIYGSTQTPARTFIDSVAAGTATFVDTTMDPNEIHFYRITAVDFSLNESGFSNEVSTFAEKYPDLLVTQVLAPAEVWSGQDLHIEWTVRNMGEEGTDAPRWYDKVYLSKDPVLSAQDGSAISIGSFDNFSYLGANEGYKNACSYTLPRDLSGTYYVHVITDANGHLIESNEENNAAVSVAVLVRLYPYPELQVTRVRVNPEIPASGDTVTVEWTVKNFGDAPTDSDHWFDTIYLAEKDSFDFNFTIDPKLIHVNETTLQWLEHSGMLAADSSYTASRRVALPHKIHGPYFVFVYTDQKGSGYVAERGSVYEYQYELNNWRSDSIYVVASELADLLVSDVSAPPTACLGEKISIEWTVENRSTTKPYESGWYDAVYLSSKPVFDPDSAALIGKFYQSNPFAEDSIYSKQVQVEIPGGFSDTTYAFVSTDCNDQVTEFDAEDNNVSARTVVLDVSNPDFVVTDVSASDSASWGQSITVSWTVKNQGECASYNRAWSDRVALSTTPVFNPDSIIVLGEYPRSGDFAKDSAYVTQQNAALPNGIEGKYYVLVETDWKNEIYEDDYEGNNISAPNQAHPIHIKPSPYADLYVSSVRVMGQAVGGKTLTIIWTVGNQGTAPTNASSWTDSLYVSRSDVFLPSDATFLKRVERKGLLNKSDSYTPSTSIVVPPNLEGTCYFYVKTDADNRVFEHTREDNNIARSESLNILGYPPVDLTVDRIIVHDSAASGLPVQITWSVTNNGPGKTTVTRWGDAVYLSADTVFDASNDLLILELAHSGALDSSKSYTRNPSVRLPEVSGDFYVFVKCGVDNNVIDMDLTNNLRISTEAISIILTPTPDLQVAALLAPKEVTAGQPVTVHFQIQNNGTGTTSESAWYEGFYLSKDPYLDKSDMKLSTYTREGVLAPIESYYDSIEVEIPVYAYGSYFLILLSFA